MYSIRRYFALALLPILTVGCKGHSSKDVEPARVTSEGAVASPALINTYWKLMELGGKPVTVADNQREPYIVLQPDPKQVNGSGGCNRLFGSYETSGSSLAFGGIGATKMACTSGMETEAAFLPVLGRVARWRITSQQLELSDSTGALLVRFEARAMK